MLNRIKNILFWVIGLFLMLYLLKNIFNYQSKVIIFDEVKNELKKEKIKQEQLKSEIVKSKNFFLIEHNIREKLNLQKENEISIIMPKINISPTPTPTPIKMPIQKWFELAIFK